MPRSGVASQFASMNCSLPIILWIIQFITVSVFIYAVSFIVASVAVNGDFGVLGTSYITILIFFFLLLILLGNEAILIIRRTLTPDLYLNAQIVKISLFIITLVSIEVFELAWGKRDINHSNAMLTRIIWLTLIAGQSSKIILMLCCKGTSSPLGQSTSINGRKKRDRVFDRRGTWPQDPVLVIGGARSPGASPTRQTQSHEEPSIMDKMDSAFDTPMGSQFDQHEQLEEQNSHEPPRRNSLSGSIRELAKKALGRGSSTKSAPKLTSYFDSWSRRRQPVRQAESEAQMNEPPRSVSRGRQPVRQAEKKAEIKAQMNEPPRSMYQELPYGLDESVLAPRPRQDYDAPSQPQHLGYNAIPPSPTLTAMSSPYDQNLTPQSDMSGPAVEHPHQKPNGGYYCTGFNVQLSPNHPNNHGPYVSPTATPQTLRRLLPTTNGHITPPTTSGMDGTNKQLQTVSPNHELLNQ
ncbi:hypothetical protein IFR05_012597 [Cadophora sp. M221]|nr:hypothetical protein IFR05_012597 [Cadophora sp. M221]